MQTVVHFRQGIKDTEMTLKKQPQNTLIAVY